MGKINSTFYLNELQNFKTKIRLLPFYQLREFKNDFKEGNWKKISHKYNIPENYIAQCYNQIFKNKE